MTRGRIRIFLLLVCLCVPYITAYAAPLVPSCPPTGCRMCDLVTLLNNLIKFVIWLTAFVFVAVMVMNGFKMITTGEAGEIKKSLTNIVVGIVIMLVAWTAIDTVGKILTGGRWGPWHTISCVDNPSMQVLNPSGVGAGGFVNTGATGGGRGTGAQCSAANTACSLNALRAAGMTEAQANVMSCIAMTESSGNPNAVNPSGGACGTFQILPSNWNNPRLHPPGSGCGPSTPCTDARCNALVAQSLMAGRSARGQSPYGDWTCPGCNAHAQGCVARYGTI